MSYNAKLRSNDLIRNHEGAKAWMQTPEFELYSTVVNTMSVDDKFYENGSCRVNRIASLVRLVSAEFVAQLAVYARTEMHLRSVPMLLLVELSQCHSGDGLVGRATELVIQRVDDITELLSCYQWRHRSKNLKHLSNQLRKGIARAFCKFDEYQFAKYNRKDKSVTLRDALFITHPKAKDESQQLLFDKIAHDCLEVPYTWETQLSEAGKGKGLTAEERRVKKYRTWVELIESRRMGYMATLRNLRNMITAGLGSSNLKMAYSYLSDADAVRKSKILPFRFFTAYLMMTGHTENVLGNLYCSPLYDKILFVQQKMEAIDTKLHNLKNRSTVMLMRKVCRRRPNFRESTMVNALNESGLLKLQGIVHSWHESRTCYYRRRHTKVSRHLGKYIAHLDCLKAGLRKKVERYYYLYGKLRSKEEYMKKYFRQKPFYAPMETLNCLEKAVMHSAESIPSFDESTRVCIACDTSGSMQSPISGNSIMQCYDLALFFGAMMKYRIPDAVVGMFGDIWKTIDMPGDNIMANVLKMRYLRNKVGCSTNGHKVIEWLQCRQMVMDKVIMFTDCQLWNSRTYGTDLSSAWNRYKRTVAPGAKLYLFDLAGYGQSPVDLDGEKDVYMIAGWSDKIFDMLAALENGESVIDKIRRIAV